MNSLSDVCRFYSTCVVFDRQVHEAHLCCVASFWSLAWTLHRFPRAHHRRMHLHLLHLHLHLHLQPQPCPFPKLCTRRCPASPRLQPSHRCVRRAPSSSEPYHLRQRRCHDDPPFLHAYRPCLRGDWPPETEPQAQHLSRHPLSSFRVLSSRHPSLPVMPPGRSRCARRHSRLQTQSPAC